MTGQTRTTMARIEPATLEDLPQLAELLLGLFAQEADFEPDREKQLGGLRQIIEDARIGRILVARDGREVVGMVNLLFTISTAEGGRVAWLEDLIVHPSHRGKGMGSQLIKEAVQFARERGIRRITLLTDGDNSDAIRFYERHGFSKSAMRPMRLHL
jgi:GNAT superfamily N-acetyltransferase